MTQEHYLKLQLLRQIKHNSQQPSSPSAIGLATVERLKQKIAAEQANKVSKLTA